MHGLRLSGYATDGEGPRQSTFCGFDCKRLSVLVIFEYSVLVVSCIYFCSYPVTVLHCSYHDASIPTKTKAFNERNLVTVLFELGHCHIFCQLNHASKYFFCNHVCGVLIFFLNLPHLRSFDRQQVSSDSSRPNINRFKIAGKI